MTKEKFGFIALHVFLALLVVAAAVFTIYLIDIVFKVIGAVIVIVGILNFFCGTYFISGVLGLDIEWYSTNIVGKIIFSLILVLLGAACFVIRDIVEFPDTTASMIVYVATFGVGILMRMENASDKYDLSDGTKWLGKLTPIAYIIGASLFLTFTLLDINVYYAVAVLALGAVLHMVRMVAVCKEYDF